MYEEDGNSYWVTYRRADGKLIRGEFGWVDDPEMLDELLDPTEVIRETWVLHERIQYTTDPNYELDWDEEEYE